MTKITDWLCKKLNIECARGTRIHEVEVLTRQFHLTLRAHITKIEKTPPNPVPKALERIREITKKEDKDLSWQDAYEIEQQLVQLYDEPTLHVELERRLLEAEQSLHAPVAGQYRKLAEERQEDTKGLAALLSGLINDLQWRHTKNHARRIYAREITQRTWNVYTCMFVLVILIIMQLERLFEGIVRQDNFGLVLFGILAGAFGAVFSMMINQKESLARSTFDDLKLNYRWQMIFARVLMGSGTAFILFFLVRAGMLDGELFPNISPKSDKFTYLDFAKLFIMCFIAGFSEKFVPNLLSRMQKRLNEMIVELPQTPKEPPTHTTPPTGQIQGRSEGDTREGSEAANVVRNQG